MYEITRGKKFKIAYKKLIRSGKFDRDALEQVISLLTLGTDLPEKYREHFLKGPFQEKKECHITSNLLLIYEVDTPNKIITLAGIGTHAQLFGI